MTDYIDVAAVRTEMVRYLADIGFTERDADGSDFQFGDDPGLRFKIGTSYGEVAVSVYNPTRGQVLRITQDHHVDRAKTTLARVIADHWREDQ